MYFFKSLFYLCISLNKEPSSPIAEPQIPKYLPKEIGRKSGNRLGDRDIHIR